MWAKKKWTKENSKKRVKRENESYLRTEEAGRSALRILTKYRNDLRERQRQKWILRKIMHSRPSGRGIAGKRQWKHVDHSIIGKSFGKKIVEIREIIKNYYRLLQERAARQPYLDSHSGVEQTRTRQYHELRRQISSKPDQVNIFLILWNWLEFLTWLWRWKYQDYRIQNRVFTKRQLLNLIITSRQL